MDEANTTCGEIEEIIDYIEQRFKQIKQFDMLDYYPSDHHFFKYDKNYKNMTSESAFCQRIEKECLLLEKTPWPWSMELQLDEKGVLCSLI